MKKLLILAVLALVPLTLAAQADKADVRRGNRKFARDKFKEAEINYLKATLKDSTSVPAQYNLASSLYRQEDWEGAAGALEKVQSDDPRVWFNRGDAALQKKDYKAAVDSFRKALLQTPDDIEAKENYIYAKMMLEDQQNGGGGGSDQNQDQNQDENQDQQDQQDQQNQDNQDKQDQEQQSAEAQMTPQQAQQLLRAVQAKEKATQDKVEKEKAAALKSRQKEKNW